jgi:DNA (cytosine-5-)-methyltransferase
MNKQIKNTESIKIINNDSLKEMEKISSDSIDLILTDPPYNLGNFMNNRNTNLKKMRNNFFAASGWDNLKYEDWIKNMDKFFMESHRILKKGGTLLIFMSILKIESLIAISEKYNFYYKTTGIWHKKNPMPRNMNLHFVNSNECWIYFINEKKTGTFNNEKLELDYIETSITPINEKKYGKHPTQKPIALMEHFVKLLSNENETILDPFLGSGTTAVASKKLKRKFIGIEINPEYYLISKKRVENEK